MSYLLGKKETQERILNWLDVSTADVQESFSHVGSDSDILMFSAGCCCILVTMAMCLINNDNQHRVAHF